MEIFSRVTNAVRDGYDTYQFSKLKLHMPAYYINGQVFGNDCEMPCQECFNYLDRYYAQMESDLRMGIRYVDW